MGFIGFELDYNPYDFDNSDGYTVWTGKGRDYQVINMTISHIKNARRMCQRLADSATFDDVRGVWLDWLEVFDNEIKARKKPKARPPIKRSNTTSKKATGLVKMVCGVCDNDYQARAADLRRGWGLSCSKRCAAIRRENNSPAGQPKTK